MVHLSADYTVIVSSCTVYLTVKNYYAFPSLQTVPRRSWNAEVGGKTEKLCLIIPHRSSPNLHSQTPALNIVYLKGLLLK